MPLAASRLSAHRSLGAGGETQTLGRLIGALKTTSTTQINETRKSPGSRLWQRNFYERVIRNEDEMNRVRQYVLDNPAKWPEDRENPSIP